jgi:uncharacterized protein
MLAVSIVLIALALVGHAALWVGVVNRWHATGFPRPLVKSVALLFHAALLAIPVAVLAYLAGPGANSFGASDWTGRLNWATAYIAFCAAYGALHVPVWAVGRWRSRRPPECVRRRDQSIVDVAGRLGASPARGPWARSLSLLPFNQLWHLEVGEFEVELPRLRTSLEGLAICHLSDLHYSGRIDRSYFVEVVRLANAMQVDLIVLTGDVCDRARYIPWIPETLGRLEARLGKFFVLGNHDLRTKSIDRLRQTLGEAGFVDVGGRHETIEHGGIVVAGDERPWFKSVPRLDGVPGEALKLLLAHTPDRLKWARAQGFDLMFAGHTHGGQVRFPLIGAVVCPSWHGTRYASGFFQEPPTVLHVSRGAAGMFPYRLNCRPEITKLVLRRAT